MSAPAVEAAAPRAVAQRGAAGAGVADRLVLTALILFAAVAPLLPTNELKTDVTVLAALLLGAGAYLWWRSGAMERSPLDLPVLALLAVAVLSTNFSVDRFVSFFPSTRRGEGLVVFAVYLLMALAAARLNRRQVAMVIGATLIGGTLIALVAIPQYYGVDPAAWAGFEPVTQTRFYGVVAGQPAAGPLYGARSHGTLGNPIFLGGYMALLLPVAVSGALTAPRRWWLYGVAAVCLYGALIASQTRAAWMAAAIAGVLLFAGLRGARLSGRRLAAVAIAFALATAVMTFTQPKVSLSQRALSAFRTGDASLAERIYLWKKTLPLIAQRPVLGWGFSTLLGRFPDLGSPEYVRVYGWHAVGIDTPHNELLHVAYSIGLAGLAAYLWVWATLARALRRTRRRDESMPYLSAALLAALAGYFLWLQLAWNHIGPAQAFWTLGGLAAAVGARHVSETADGRVA